jgi:hypothetical protein
MVTVKLIKKDGKFTYLDDKNKLLYQIFQDKVPEGKIIEMYMGLAENDRSLPQLAKVHACIRELAKESGYTFEEMKLVIKQRSGLCYEVNGLYECKSFADCSKDELALAIEACIEIGKELNVNLQ